jgi:hypothetical protein
MDLAPRSIPASMEADKMNQDIEVTHEMVLRFPFAVNPDRVTDAQEVIIGQDMAKRAREEGHMQRLPQGINKQNASSQEKLGDMGNKIVQLLRDGEARSVSQLKVFLAARDHDVRMCLNYLLEAGVVKSRVEKRVTLYEHARKARIMAGKATYDKRSARAGNKQ